MNCNEFWAEGRTSEAGDRHLRECTACAARMAQQEHLLAGLRSLRDGLARVEAPPRVEAKLMTAFRSRNGYTRSSGRRRWIPAVSWATAAAIIAGAVFLVSHRAPEPQATTPKYVETVAMDGLEEGFLPLPGAAQPGAQEEVSVLHVELPRSAMMQVGIEVNPERAGETVRADVMVGADGLARAVRFADETGSD